MSSKRILLAASNPLYREAAADVIARIEGIKFIGKVGNGWEVVQLSAQLKPDIILIDFRLPGLSGLETARVIKQQVAGVVIIILIDDDGKECINAVMQSGGWAYLKKNQIVRELPALLNKLERTNKENVRLQLDTQPVYK